MIDINLHTCYERQHSNLRLVQAVAEVAKHYAGRLVRGDGPSKADPSIVVPSGAIGVNTQKRFFPRYLVKIDLG